MDVLNCLVNSMRGTTRITSVSYTTIAKLVRRLGPLAWQYHDEHVGGVHAKRLQCDEVWPFVGAKRTAQRLGRRDAGGVWTWLALDPDTKLVVSYLCGPRTLAVAKLPRNDAQEASRDRPDVCAYFGGSGPPISAEADHRFRRKWNIDGCGSLA